MKLGKSDCLTTEVECVCETEERSSEGSIKSSLKGVLTGS